MVASWVDFFLVALVSFFLSPFVVHHLGASDFGAWTVAGGLMGYLGLLDFGIRQAVNRYVAHHWAVADHESASAIGSAALRVLGAMGIVAIVLSSIVAVLAPILFNIPDSLVHDIRIVIVLGGVGVAVSLVSGIFQAAVTGIERSDVVCLFNVLVTIVRSAGIIIALAAGYGLVSMAWIQLGTTVLNAFLVMVAAHRLYGQMRPRLTGDVLPQVRTLVMFGASVTVVNGLSQLIYFSDMFVIAAFLPIEAVTFYAIAKNLCLQVRGLATSMAYLMTPRVSALTSLGSNRVGEEILAVAKLATIVAAPVAMTFWLRGESFITLWMGPEYGPASGEILRILGLVVWLESWRSVLMYSFTGMGKQRTLIPGIAFEAVFNLAISIALVRSLGIVGVALGTLIPSVLVSLVYFPNRLAAITAVPLGLFYRKAVFLPTVACIPFALASFATERFFPAGNLAVFFLQVFATLPLVVVAGWYLCLTPAERSQTGSQIRKMLGQPTATAEPPSKGDGS